MLKQNKIWRYWHDCGAEWKLVGQKQLPLVNTEWQPIFAVYRVFCPVWLSIETTTITQFNTLLETWPSETKERDCECSQKEYTKVLGYSRERVMKYLYMSDWVIEQHCPFQHISATRPYETRVFTIRILWGDLLPQNKFSHMTIYIRCFHNVETVQTWFSLAIETAETEAKRTLLSWKSLDVNPCYNV